jgi:hypothetical protein
MLSLASLCSAVFRTASLCKWKFSSMFQSNLDLPLNTKKVYKNITELLPKFGNFWVIGSELWIFDSQPPNFTPSFYAYPFWVSAYTCTLCEWLPQMLFTWGSNDSFWSPKSCGKFETFSSGLCMQLAFIAVRTHLGARVRAWFWHLSLIPDVCLRIRDRWCAGMDSLELPRGGWFSCTFVGHPKGLWVRRVSRVLGTWAHEHRPTASLGSEGEDPCVPDTSYLGRVGGEGIRVELGWHRAKGCFGSTHNFLWEACWFGR